MKIINDNQTLIAYFPNVQTTIDDEGTLFSKIKSHLEISELWLQNNIIGEKTLDEIALQKESTIFALTAQAIVADAMAAAVPSLDLIMTPNGFGIVNNNNLVPASKERIERLIVSLKKATSKAHRNIITMLQGIESWQQSPQCKWFAKSLICKPEDVWSLGKQDEVDEWSAFISARDEAFSLETEMTDQWISPELMDKCRHALAVGDFDSDYGFVAHRLRQILILSIREQRLREKSLMSVVNYIRNNSKLFPEWGASETAKLFEDNSFKNDKSKGGYFFHM